MTEPVDPVSSSKDAQPSETNQKTSPTGAAPSAATKASTMKELKEKAPEVYDQMLKSMAQQVINFAKRSQERFKQIMRKGRNQQ